MTPERAGMTPERAGMTPERAGMTPEGAGMTPEGAGMTPEGAGSAPGPAGREPGPAAAQAGPGLTTLTIGGPGLAGLPAVTRRSAWWALAGLIRRDLLVLVREWPALLVGIVAQPLLLVFVFTYVLPKAGFAIGGPREAAAYSTLLVAGVVGLAAFTQGFQGVTIRFAVEFGYTKEIEDRVLAPLPLWWLGIEKILVGALQAALAGIMVVPISALVPATAVHLDPRWPALAGIGLLVALLSASFGLAAGTILDPRHIQLAATALILPVTFFGAVYYPWELLSAIPWLKYADLVNPLVYMNEALRAVLTTGIPHMTLWVSCAAMAACTAGLAALGINGLYRRALS